MQRSMRGSDRGGICRRVIGCAERIGRTALVTVTAFALLCVVAATVGAGAGGEDSASTHTYLAAEYTYEQEVERAMPASRAALQALVQRIEGECPAVLASLATGPLAPVSSLPPATRKAGAGERRRIRGQLSELDNEISYALVLSWIAPDRQALLADVAKIEPLRWSDPKIAQLVHARVAAEEALYAITPPDVCADTKAWVASGFQTLAAGTTDLVSKLAALPTSSRGEFMHLLANHENAQDRMLLQRTGRLALKLGRSTGDLLPGPLSRLSRVLGLGPLLTETSGGPAAESVAITHGRTAAGETYTVTLQPQTPRPGETQQGSSTGATPQNAPGSTTPQNPPSATAPQSPPSSATTQPGCLRLTIEAGSGRGGACLTRGARRAAPSVNCTAGLLTIQSQTLTATRSVRLRLNNGREITTPVALVPAKLGGPVGFYYQAVRGPSPIPVSLTELDVHGRALRVVKLPRVVECTKNPVKYFPGGYRKLLHGRVTQQGPIFAIIAEHYRFLGHVYFELTIETRGGGVGSASFLVGGTIKQKPSPFAMQNQIGCQPHQYVIIYGLLKAPRDKVLVRIAGKLQALRHVHIPASMHAGGVLAYAVLPAMPKEILVRSPSGTIVNTETLGVLPACNQQEEGEGEEEEGAFTASAGARP